MSIVLAALEKAQKEKDRAEAQLLLQRKTEAEKPPIKIEEEHNYSKPDIEKVQEKGQEAKTKLVPPARQRFHKKYLVLIIALVSVNLFFIVWWLNYNNSIVYEDSSNESRISVPRDIPAPAPENLFLETSQETDIIERPHSLNVTGVVWDPKDPIVLVNGRFLKKGDEIIGAKILDIQLHEVRFLYKEKEFTVSVE